MLAQELQTRVLEVNLELLFERNSLQKRVQQPCVGVNVHVLMGILTGHKIQAWGDTIKSWLYSQVLGMGHAS